MGSTFRLDPTPLSDEWFETQGWEESMNGFGKLIDGDGHVIELFLLEGEEGGIYHASMMQSDPPDSILITGRTFSTVGDVDLLLAALGSGKFSTTGASP